MKLAAGLLFLSLGFSLIGPCANAQNAPFDFNILLGAKGLSGSAVSKDGTSVPSRSMAAYGADLTLGFRTSLLFVGAGASLSRWEQMQSASELNNINVSGTLLQYSAVVGLVYGRFALLGKYHVAASYKASITDSYGAEVEYSSSKSPFSLSMLMALGTRSYLGLEYSNQEFGEIKRNGNTQAGSSAQALRLSGAGATIGWFY